MIGTRKNPNPIKCHVTSDRVVMPDNRVGRYNESPDSNIELKKKEYPLPMESLMILSLRFETVEY
jgi:hypothetical protein